MKVQLVGVVVVPWAAKFSVRLAPGAIVCWNRASHAALTSSLGSTTASSQSLIALPLLLTMVNWPWKPFHHWCTTE